MEPFTLYLDADSPQRSKWFWIFQSSWALIFFIQNLNMFTHADGTKRVSAIILFICAGILIAVNIVFFFFSRNSDRRPVLAFDNQGLTYRPNYFRATQKIAWNQVSDIHIKATTVEVSTTETPTPISITMPGYVLAQQIKQLFHTAAEEHGIQIS